MPATIGHATSTPENRDEDFLDRVLAIAFPPRKPMNTPIYDELKAKMDREDTIFAVFGPPLYQEGTK